MILWLLVGIAAFIAGWLIIWSVVSFFVVSGRRQKQFLGGSKPVSQPAGFYRGTAYLLGGRPVPWLGKSFEPENDLGFNIFTPRGAKLLKILTPLYRGFRRNTEGNTEAYYFKTSAGTGFKDERIDTFKLDYDSPSNPFLIRIILDEMVEIKPGEFLGKVHLKVFPGYFATIGFFGLKKIA